MTYSLMGFNRQTLRQLFCFSNKHKSNVEKGRTSKDKYLFLRKSSIGLLTRIKS